MVNYGNGLIYKLCCNDTNIKEEYVGSTVNFTERKRTHKKSCNNPNDKHYNYKVYQFIRDNGDWDNWRMILVERFPCNDRRELETRERYFIELLESKLNCCIPTRTDKEWRENNKETIKEKAKEHYQNNKEEIKKRVRERYNNLTDEEKKERYNYPNLTDEQKKEQYNKNRKRILENHEEYKEYMKNYHKEHKEDEEYMKKKKENSEQKTTCECGMVLLKKHIKRHQSRQIHINLMNNKK